MNETATFRRVVAGVTIGSFSLAALMGIVALLGGDGGALEGRVLLTTLIVGCASICMLCYLATAGTRWAPVGALGGVVSTLPLVTSLCLVWIESSLDSESLWKGFGAGIVGAVTLAQICLLLGVFGHVERLAIVLWPTVVLASLVAILISGLILGEIDADAVWRWLGVLAILDVLGTLITIALGKFGGRDSEIRPREAVQTAARRGA